MSKFWLIQGTICRREDSGYTRTNQFPSFYLDGNLLGIVSEAHAIRIACFVLNPLNDPKIEVNACASDVILHREEFTDDCKPV